MTKNLLSFLEIKIDLTYIRFLQGLAFNRVHIHLNVFLELIAATSRLDILYLLTIDWKVVIGTYRLYCSTKGVNTVFLSREKFVEVWFLAIAFNRLNSFILSFYWIIALVLSFKLIDKLSICHLCVIWLSLNLLVKAGVSRIHFKTILFEGILLHLCISFSLSSRCIWRFD